MVDKTVSAADAANSANDGETVTELEGFEGPEAITGGNTRSSDIEVEAVEGTGNDVAPSDAADEISADSDGENVDTPGEDQDTETPDEQLNAEQEDEAEPEKAKPKTRAQERIEQLAREKSEAQADAEYYKQQLEELQGPTDEEQLDRYDFATDEEYEQHLANKSADRVLSRQAEAEAKRAANRVAQIQVKQHEARVEDARKRIADFDEVVMGATDVPTTPEMSRTIVESELGAEIAYYLAKHPDEARQITEMQPVQQYMALGKLEERVSSVPKKVVSTTPKPVTKVTGGNSAPTFDAEKSSYQDYRKQRMAEMHGD